METNTAPKLAPSLNGIIEQSIRDNWELTALSDMGGVNLQFNDVAVYIEKLPHTVRGSRAKTGRQSGDMRQERFEMGRSPTGMPYSQDGSRAHTA